MTHADRSTLPIPDRTPEPSTILDAKDPAVAFPVIEPLRPPDGAPNVLVILLDDVGCAASSAFGGPIATPTAERLSAEGHDTASPVSDDYSSVFSGTVRWVQIDRDEAAEDLDHLITPEERLRVAMARQ